MASVVFGSLRTRFYAVGIGIATIPILLLGLTIARSSSIELERQSLALQRALAFRVEREISSFVETRLNELHLIERTNSLVTMDDTALAAIVGRLLAHDRAYQALTVRQMDGRRRAFVSRVDARSPSVKTAPAPPYLRPTFWRDMRQFVGPVLYDEKMREPMFEVAIPIVERRTGEATGVLVARIRFQQIWNLMADLRLPAETEAFVVAADGRMLAHRAATAVLSRQVFDLPEADGRHNDALVVLRPMSLVGESAFVVVTRPIGSALAVSIATRDTTLLLTVALLLVAMLMAMLQTRQVVGPIEKLAAAAQRMSRGELNTRVEVSGPAEIQELGHVLQNMAERLGEIVGELEHAEFAERQRAMVTLESIGDAVITTDADGAVNYLNPVACKLTGWPLESARGQPVSTVFNIINEQTRKPAPNPVARCLGEGRVVGLANHTVLVSRDGSEYAIQDSAAPIREPDGKVLGVVMVFSDVTSARAMQKRISHQATHDSLTGLVNRHEFEHRLGRVLESIRDESSEHALCYLDLDQFKVINDTCGHAAGDELLRQLTVLLRQTVRRRDTLARLGGDEFAVLMEHCDLEHAQRVAEALRSTVERFRFTWETYSFTLGVSIGLVPITRSSDSVTKVLRAADSACYLAKDAGRNRVHVYHDDDAEITKRRDEMQWVGTLTQALEEGRFELFAQPIVEIGTRGRPGAAGGVEHFELLLRLVNARGERIRPALFLPAAERYNLITRIDRWVVERTFDWLAQRTVDAAPLLCSLNISGSSLGENEFLDFVLGRLDHTGIAGEQICFEITETAAIGNLAMATHFMQAVRRRGCRFALDDFGSGLSSFAYLKALPVEYLKIDGVFIKDMASDQLDFAMVRSINEVGQLLGMHTIAEFVETKEVLEKLTELGVDAAQGHHFGHPEPLIVAGWRRPS